MTTAGIKAELKFQELRLDQLKNDVWNCRESINVLKPELRRREALKLLRWSEKRDR